MQTDYALYLRKSRADLEAEAHGEGDTLHPAQAYPHGACQVPRAAHRRDLPRNRLRRAHRKPSRHAAASF